MSGEEKLRRRHHVVPKFHLKRFANDRNQIIRVELPGDVRHPISINDATVAKDFYLVEDSDGQPSDDVEKLLGEIETDAATAIRDLVDGWAWPLPPETRTAVATWVAVQLLRTTVQRQVGAELMAAWTKKQSNWIGA